MSYNTEDLEKEFASFYSDGEKQDVKLSYHDGWGSWDNPQMKWSVDLSSITSDFLDKEALLELVNILEQKEKDIG